MLYATPVCNVKYPTMHWAHITSVSKSHSLPYILSLKNIIRNNSYFLIVLCRSERTIDHKWTYPGFCPQPVGNWSWIPFRNNCYSFVLHELQLKHEAMRTCSKGNIFPKTDTNVFIKTVKKNTLNLCRCFVSLFKNVLYHSCPSENSGFQNGCFSIH